MRFKWPLKLALHGYLNQAPYLSVLCGAECTPETVFPSRETKEKAL